MGSEDNQWRDLYINKILGDGDNIIAVESHLIPVSAGGWNLGTDGERWSTLYVNTIDINGNIIPESTSNTLGNDTNAWGDLYTNQITAGQEISERFTVGIDGDLIPILSDTWNLGSTANRWNNIYINNINFSGNIIPASTSNTLGDEDNAWGDLYINQITAGSEVNSRFTIGIDGDLVPILGDTWHLGSSSNRWNTLYINNINLDGSITGLDLDNYMPLTGESNRRWIRHLIPFTQGDMVTVPAWDLGDNTSLGRWRALYVNNINIGGNIIGNLIASSTSNTLGDTDNAWGDLYTNQITAGSEDRRKVYSWNRWRFSSCIRRHLESWFLYQ